MRKANPRDTRTHILEQAIPMFAARGYSGVSMRHISQAVGTSAAALYHHFPDKQKLYFDAMAHAFADKAAGITEALEGKGTAAQRLERFIASFTRLMGEDPDFRALLQRELLDGDETRLKLVAEEVFSRPFRAMTALAEELAPEIDAHMLAISMAGLVLFHFETAPVRRFLPGGRARHNDPKTIARHVTQLLTRAFGGG
ncbi:MAG: TetR/AcrR family transcriptional regulator [Gammaproteobacteria bacterium]|nr:TetR/AcrR family transcriptional regulator [Gammaproteobacteria bacterium]MCB1852075.1 TetR/AcrR family transcriptional regulator [Gammaproteobacteria bacterium]